MRENSPTIAPAFFFLIFLRRHLFPSPKVPFKLLVRLSRRSRKSHDIFSSCPKPSSMILHSRCQIILPLINPNFRCSLQMPRVACKRDASLVRETASRRRGRRDRHGEVNGGLSVSRRADTKHDEQVVVRRTVKQRQSQVSIDER